MEFSWIYAQHVREFTPKQVLQLFEDAGFDCSYSTTLYSSFYFNEPERDVLLAKSFPDEGDREEQRGDEGLYIFTKM